jgi:hypothetical protein
MAIHASNELEEALSRWQLDAAAVRERMYRAPTRRERERWHALWLALQGYTAFAYGDMVRASTGQCMLHPQLARAVVAGCRLEPEAVDAGVKELRALLMAMA